MRVLRGILRFAVCVAAIPLCAQYFEGVTVASTWDGMLLGAALGGIYLLLRPLARMITSVFSFFTLGLIHVALDAWIVQTAAWFFKDTITIASFWWALAVAGVINAARFLIGAVLHTDRD